MVLIISESFEVSCCIKGIWSKHFNEPKDFHKGVFDCFRNNVVEFRIDFFFSQYMHSGE